MGARLHMMEEDIFEAIEVGGEGHPVSDEESFGSRKLIAPKILLDSKVDKT